MEVPGAMTIPVSEGEDDDDCGAEVDEAVDVRERGAEMTADPSLPSVDGTAVAAPVKVGRRSALVEAAAAFGPGLVGSKRSPP